MNHIINESGEKVISVGQDGSHARIKEQFDYTLPLMIEAINNQWVKGGLERHLDYSVLEDIMVASDIHDSMHSALIRSSYFYSDASVL